MYNTAGVSPPEILFFIRMIRQVRSTNALAIALTLMFGINASTCCAQTSDIFFETRIRPVLAQHCYRCHSAEAASKDRLKGGLQLDTPASIFRGGSLGAILIAGQSDESLIVRALRHDKLKMPPDQPLPNHIVKDFERWIDEGAIIPVTTHSTTESGDHWSLRPIRTPSPPDLDDHSWVQTPIDHFILNRLQENDLTPVSAADRRTLLRRITYDLVGLPPDLDELKSFMQDCSPYAIERVIDRLLASPHYGERWGRHWLDVVRYADTTANDGNFVMRYAWRYRNYVIDALNRDLPYDAFIVEQIAGDLLPKTGQPSMDTQRTIATGFLMLGPKGLAEADKEQLRLDIADEQLDVIGRGFMALTISCARCHDHKFDPIPTQDYYSLAGILRGIEVLNGNTGPTSMWYEQSVDQYTAKQKAKLQSLRSVRDELEVQLQQRHSTVSVDQRAWKKELQQEDNPTTANLPDSVRQDLVLWCEASDVMTGQSKTAPTDGAPVIRWEDRSSRANHLLPVHPDRAPLYVSEAVNGRPAVRFGNDGYQTLISKVPRDLPSGNRGRTLFIVNMPLQRSKSPDPGLRISQVVSWGDFSGTRRWNLYQHVEGKVSIAYGNNDFQGHRLIQQNGEPVLFVQKHRQSESAGESKSTFWVNGLIEGTLVPDQDLMTQASSPLVVGSNYFQSEVPSHQSFANVAEILLVSRDLTEVEHNQVGHYLAVKYGIKTDYLALAEKVAMIASSGSEGQKESLTSYYLNNVDQTFRTLQAQLNDTDQQLQAIQEKSPPITVMAPKELGSRPLRVHNRGNRFQLGEPAPPRFLVAISGTDQTPLKTSESGRLELAQWIARGDHPLTARVMVNRVWQYHFSRGLVVTSDNFGKRGQLPSHPDLLDYLAARFIATGWSLKALHKLILLSAVYQQSSFSGGPSSSSVSKDPMIVDPDNTLLWKYPRRRNDAEVIRDAILMVSGKLKRDDGGEGTSIMNLFDQGETVSRQLGLASVANIYEVKAFTSNRRTVYLPVIRNGLLEIGSLFDTADPNAVTTRRNESIVSKQALFMMNSHFVRGYAMQFAHRLMSIPTPDNEKKITRAFQLCFSRQPTDQERSDASSYLGQYVHEMRRQGHEQEKATLLAWQSYAQLLFCMNEFIYVD